MNAKELILLTTISRGTNRIILVKTGSISRQDLFQPVPRLLYIIFLMLIWITSSWGVPTNGSRARPVWEYCLHVLNLHPYCIHIHLSLECFQCSLLKMIISTFSPIYQNCQTVKKYDKSIVQWQLIAKHTHVKKCLRNVGLMNGLIDGKNLF